MEVEIRMRQGRESQSGEEPAPRSAPMNHPAEHPGYRLAKVVGAFAIVASAVSQEYGTGINFVLVNSLGQYPRITTLVPLAMIGAGLLLIPNVALFMSFSRVIPRAGSSYVWLSRSLNLPVGFVIAFLWFVGVVASMGFLAYSFSSFLGTALDALGLDASLVLSHAGHLVVGLALIWLIFLLHYTGVKNYSAFVIVIFYLVLIAAALPVYFGFSTSPATFLSKVTPLIGRTPVRPADSSPSLLAFVQVMTLFMFAYAGLEGAASLGGEARNAPRRMPRGIFGGWLIALLLYSLVAVALFHAVPWYAVGALIASEHAAVATTPGLIGLVAPRTVAVFMNVVVTVIAGKTVAPQMLDCSRFLFAWSQDGLLPPALARTSGSQVPHVALVITALLGSLFLVDATFAGWQIGVLLRSMSLVLVFGGLGAGALNLRWNRAYRDLPWAQTIASRRLAIIGLLAIIIAAGLLVSVITVPKTAWYLQPSVQGVAAALIGGGIYAWASRRARRQGIDLRGTARAQLPVE